MGFVSAVFSNTINAWAECVTATLSCEEVYAYKTVYYCVAQYSFITLPLF